MALLQLFITASIPVLKVLLITALGSYLALERVNILGEQTRKNLNTIVFYVFSPALVGVNLAQTITYDNMIKLWFMPVNIMITFIVGSVLGWILIQLARPPPHLRGLILGCCAAGNLGNLLLIIIPAVCKEKGSPFGAPDVCHTYGMAYASLSMATGAIYIWSYVYNIVRISSKRITQDSSQSLEEASESDQVSYTEPLLSSKECGIVEDNADQYALPCTISQQDSKIEPPSKSKNFIVRICEKLNLKTIFAPSTIGAIVGFVIGVIPQIRKLTIGDSAPLRVIQDTANLLGDGAIPALTLIIGGNLLKGLRGSGIHKSIVVGIIIVRYVFLPLTGILIIKGALKFGLVDSDPLYLFVLLVQYTLPPAMNIGTITQLFGAGESECSVIMLWTYAFASVSLTLWSAFFMWFVARIV
ncbi:protein PIN-LIKES 3-like [Argentina anserina]|uniref:protein PIN-LIKES 3-like n=1 Tax=Argentina anserina TaxID=57926 RepID=UPI0021764E38|nr:protein PIN-LIKES 3-like [Potentilla anserina]